MATICANKTEPQEGHVAPDTLEVHVERAMQVRDADAQRASAHRRRWSDPSGTQKAMIAAVPAVAILCLLHPASGHAHARPASETVPLSFADCVARIPELATSYGASPVTMVATDQIRVVQFRTSDASIMAICNKVESTMVTTVTPYNCGKACSRRPFMGPFAPQ